MHGRRRGNLIQPPIIIALIRDWSTFTTSNQQSGLLPPVLPFASVRRGLHLLYHSTFWVYVYCSNLKWMECWEQSTHFRIGQWYVSDTSRICGPLNSDFGLSQWYALRLGQKPSWQFSLPTIYKYRLWRQFLHLFPNICLWFYKYPLFKNWLCFKNTIRNEMAKRIAQDNLWELHKKELQQLYEVDDKSLLAVMEHMKTKHGLDRK